MNTKKILIYFIISLLFTNVFSQETTTISESDSIPETSTTIETSPALAPTPTSDSSPVAAPTSKTAFKMENIDFILQFEPILYLSPESKRDNSNIANVLYSFTIGASFPRDFFLSFQPTISFFSLHHAWLGNVAVPTEIENRTSTTLSFMVNLPAAYNIFLDKSRVQITAGLGALLRFGLLSNGVNDGDSGYTGSAATDVKEINKWFWENGRWLYLSVGGSWLYDITDKIKVGPILNIYIPFTSIVQYKKPQDLMISIGVKICR